ncbi:MAG TPA: ATP-binding protein [Thermoanaerobaculia bacterium]|jgi:SpoVK/Ycf46/Vps4 family AAA+-type ATPase|nr:ATP-binding protein [Thermoanaerobaculia bacterium]
MASPLFSLFTGRASRRTVETIVPERTFADVVLPPETRRTLDDALAQVRNHNLIFSRWGLGERHASGLGLAFNFAGPPGTGKTICAEAIAHSLGMKLLVVDYAELESMWMGETPKNIAAAFRSAVEQNAVLFFDEADAIAVRRSAGAALAQERESNVTVNVLLREVEAFNGVVIFATNLAANFDPAFERRIRTHVRFLMPGADERERIWQVQIHPRKTPLAADVNFREIAQRFAASGGEIKNAVLKAASAAAAESGADSNKAIHQHHLVRAMEEVLAAKAVMKQSLFEDGLTQPEDPIVTALQAAEQRWRSVALMALGLAGGALVAAIVAVTIALMR